MKRNIYLLSLIVLLFSCKKDEEMAPVNDLNNRINYVIADNKFNFSCLQMALTVTNMSDKLAGEGPFTVLAPDDNAFQAAGYGNAGAVALESGAVLNNMVKYHVLNGRWELNKLPFRFNQEIATSLGTRLFVTRWVKNTDTVLVINGAKVTASNLKASNGLIQVLSAVLQPLAQSKISDAIAGDSSLTFFNVALQQAGMKELLRGEGPYTIFAPSNNAFRQEGFPSIDSIAQTDASILQSMLKFHILANRRFIYDYVLSTDETDVSRQTMLNNSTTTVKLLKGGVSYTGITIEGSGNAQPASMQKSNILADNGVLHIIDKVLKENF
ncbi:MAG TPA: fasciclin domain-containing protein [Chitinophaga sp.]|uniref:fasciclin domain-containing protein n=1 Tax=Chitinophaga sp. TaxID=1869181 RepID=UPI002B5B9228|nr:fasciclin domain-containing protein [Chitinophaga sp.]HVI44038.1 fasciclin domain-containing protein [Chitinophaga sp.]